jgi:hypothetical protein
MLCEDLCGNIPTEFSPSLENAKSALARYVLAYRPCELLPVRASIRLTILGNRPAMG